jgi:hypothetical protein
MAFGQNAVVFTGSPGAAPQSGSAPGYGEIGRWPTKIAVADFNAEAYLNR